MAAQRPQLKMLTFNLGLLRMRLCNRYTVKESPPFVDERFEGICSTLARCDADVLALQEIYEEEHVRRLRAAVGTRYPYAARCDNQSAIQFHNGLLFLSRFEIRHFEILKHSQSSKLERWFGCKSCLVAHVDTPLGMLSLVNLHTTAGGGEDSESAGVDSVRQSELAEAINVCQRGVDEGCKGIVLGDFNCGPEASKPNYDFMVEQGFEDAVKRFEQGPTWDPSSPLNNLPVFAACPAQRIDHFFLHRNAGLTSVSARRVYTEATVEVASGQKVTLSDHFGVEIELITA